nr:ADP/ATP-dependent (S)-NAD(P)H-hydrate dehydratase [Cellulomonas sp. APG4]
MLARERGFTGGLMHTAATALARAAAEEVRTVRGRVVGGAVVGLVGPGSNGGDALHALALLARRGVRPTAVLTSAAVHHGGLAALRAAGGRVLTVDDGAPGEPVWLGHAVAEAFAADVVLDGLLGIGGRGGLRGPAAEIVALLEDLCRTADDAGARGRPARGLRPAVLAVDLPSGVGVDDGTVAGPVLTADRTVTFGVRKSALLLPPAAHRTGRVEVVDLGLTEVLADLDVAPAVRRLAGPDVATLWPRPGATSHKYARGVVGVVAGSAAYPGAAVLAVAGAQRAGCGMVRYVGPQTVAGAVVAAHPEVVAGQDTDVHVQAWVVGPGVAEDDDTQRERVAHVLAAARATATPVVVDAGALALLPERVGPEVVLTPHAGELAALLTRAGLDVAREQVEAEPLRWATEAHRRTGATVLLKGAVTLVVGAEVLSQADASPWLATAGAGDVLAGVLGAVLAGTAAQAGWSDDGTTDAHERAVLVARCAAAAALVHGRAAATDRPVTAGDVALALPGVLAELLG